ncbi:hypothetical protein N7492_003667 [Penicillium capsulatum]|uniref:DUF3074 domain-containing protein n=1 Tax=Penicillium capsulatum TaxID=69766 RepID=A0A9W9LXN6_9EURO|nr:hypothetical protein N7492_003667 [Penicillium capsulatum]KAJ6121752.1 hypothetical protein N7512_004217 [Penicillium capsulatum]
MPWIQLQPHLFSALPAHPALPDNSSRPQLQHFTRAALHEALELLHSIPSTFTTDPKLRPSEPSEAKVKLLRGYRKPSQSVSDNSGPQDKSKAEFWVCRQSEHVDATAQGTASWEEFETGLRSNHAEHEMEYTPSVTGIERLLEWAEEEIGEVEVDGVVFREVGVEVNLMTHTFHPTALISPRSFISLAISAAYNTQPTDPQSQSQSPTKGFVTAQIPLRSTAAATPDTLHERIIATAPRKTIFANYASVERVTLLPAQPSQRERHIDWTMATTSDAGGSIPQWVQRSWTLGGVPRAVVADVGLFMGWTMARRGSIQGQADVSEDRQTSS